MDKLNVLEQFRKIAGVYSLTAIRGTRHSEWSCSIYRGGKRIGTARRDKLATITGNESYLTHYDLPSKDEEFQLFAWADQAGPLGFDSVINFIETLMGYVFLLKEMREDVRKGRLVAVDLMLLDEHNMPRTYRASSGKKVDGAWIKGYSKINPHMQVVNYQLEV